MASLKEIAKKFNAQYKTEIVREGVIEDNPERLPSGWFEFDLQIGGGFPIGRVTEVFGAEASMKTTVMLKAIASAQRMWPDRTAVFIDVEGHLDRGWAAQMGVDVDKLYYVLPDNTEQTIDLIEGIAYAEDVSVIVLDSIAALVTQAELDKSAEDAIVGNAGLAANKLYRRLGNALGRLKRESAHRPTVLLINQIRHRMVAMGNPEVTPGGNSFKFLSNLRLRLYGKDEADSKVSKTLPAYKSISVIVKKNKVPILNAKGEVKVAILNSPEHGLRVGYSKDDNAILYHLQQLNLFVKHGKGYGLFDPHSGEVFKEYDTQKAFKDELNDDPDFKDTCCRMIFALLLDPVTGDMVDG